MNLTVLKLAILVLLGSVWLSDSSYADIYVFKDKQGVLNFTNVPNHAGYRRALSDGNGRYSVPLVSTNAYETLIRSAAERHYVNADLIRAVIKVESDFNSTARSQKGAMGLMQLMPDTARLHNVANVYDPGDNINGGVRHLRMLLGRFQGDLELSLAAYNAGMKAVEKYGGIPPFSETREYIRRVLQYFDSYRSNGHQVVEQSRQ